jgi:two-component system, NarL family, response regulator NreC
MVCGIDDMMRPLGPFACRADGADRVVPKVPIGSSCAGDRCRTGGPTRETLALRLAFRHRVGACRALRPAAAAPPGQPPTRALPCWAVDGVAGIDGGGTPGVDRPIRVLIADDHAVVRDGVRTVLEREHGEFDIVAEAADVPSTIKEVREHKPDLLTLDLTMPGGSSLAALPTCFVAHPTLAVAILTMREDPEYARQALRAGARSYVLKEAEPAELLQAFRLAVAGSNYLHPRLGAQMAAGEDAPSDGISLSEREREVIRLIANGYTNPEIAEQLHVAERTVKTYRARAIEKLGFSSRAEITAYARKLGLVD